MQNGCSLYFLFPFTVPDAPHSLNISHITANNVTLEWSPPLSIPGQLKEYHVVAQLLSNACEPDLLTAHEAELTSDCVDSNVLVSVNASDGSEVHYSFTLQSLAKYRYYRFKVAAVTSAGVGEYAHWSYARTLAGSENNTVTL